MKDKTEFCVECGSYNIEYVTRSEVFTVRGDEITVNVSYWVCKDCNVEFENLCDGNDYLAEAYKIYRKKHNMLQPEDIKALRLKYDITQGELAQILGWGLVTLSRYEKGSLQDFAHDKILRLLQQEPITLLQLLSNGGNDILGKAKYEKVKSLCENMIKIKYKCNDCYQFILDSINSEVCAV
jgi:putative zinc finger/helix-turn-helix YgiT family protein